MMLEVERVSESFFVNRSSAESCLVADVSCSSTGLCKSQSLFSNMPVDFAAYLMSSSPPGFSLYNTFNMNAFNRCNVAMTPLKPMICNGTTVARNTENACGSPLKSLNCVCFTCQSQVKLKDNSLFSPSADDSGESDNEEADVVEVDSLTEECRRLSLEDSGADTGCESPTDGPAVQNHFQNGTSKAKRVTFADCKGLALTEVRIMTEASEMPPNINPHLLASLTQGALPGVTEIPPLKLDFSQPASDYYTFREKLQQQCVCLENVVLKDYNILGTVKVKNIAFEKSVVVRVSYDSWETSTDVIANYVPSGDSGPLQYDTFSFEIHVPSTLNRHQAVEFCVQYRSKFNEFWDNNHGQNYRIVTVDYNNAQCSGYYTQDFKPNFDNVNNWSEYCSWHLIDNEVPYY